MAQKDLIIDLASLDLGTVIADAEEIGKVNPQRYEMAQLTGIVYEDSVNHVLVGFKDIGADEWWCRGHMPDMPVYPGVLMCESAAQLSGYYCKKYDLMQCETIGFGGLEDVKFRNVVVPGDRLYIAACLEKFRPKRMSISRFQGFVDGAIVFEGRVKGIPLPIEEIRAEINRRTAGG